VSCELDVTDDEIESAGVDVGDPPTLPLARASACESAERREAADAIAASWVPDFFLNMDVWGGLGTAMGDGRGELIGMAVEKIVGNDDDDDKKALATSTVGRGEWCVQDDSLIFSQGMSCQASFT